MCMCVHAMQWCGQDETHDHDSEDEELDVAARLSLKFIANQVPWDTSLVGQIVLYCGGNAGN